MDLQLAGATAVVQGGTKGMGRAAADCLAKDGARIALLARTQADLDRTAEELMAAGASEAVGLRADITDRAQVDEAFAQLARRWSSLNILVNAAGPTAIGAFDDLDDDDWIEAVELGVLGAVRCVRAALPMLRAADWARIVNVSAHSTKRQSPGLIAYTGAKAMLTSVSKNLSQTLAPEGILVNTVSPGSFASEALRGWATSMGIDPDDLVGIMRGIEEHFGHPAQLGRAGDPSEIGPVIAFLASRANTYMTGANVNVDGGSDFT
jgi:NAD(P)-dependent dehydrogenase (short-subunit alcohol dehydrogenase family)